MPFWGVEVKPGRPFTLAPDESNRKLHITQATLGHGTAAPNGTRRISLQCIKGGGHRPVLLCALSTPVPGSALCCPLNLEFQETCEVVFKVLGPVSLHLSGHYLSNGQRLSDEEDDDDAKLNGEYIADTESDSRKSEDYDYSDSFIDDDDEVRVVPATPSDGGSCDANNKKKRPRGNGRRHKKPCNRKLMVSSESESDDHDQTTHTVELPISDQNEVGDGVEENMNKGSSEIIALDKAIQASGTYDNNADQYPGSNQLLTEEIKGASVVIGRNDKSAKIKSSPGGLVVEDLEMGESDAKVAVSGKKISIHYTGKLKDDGRVFSSNVGEAPLKFRLGKGKVIEGLDIGIDGMRVGGKRRLTIPPLMGYGCEGDDKDVPPDSWLVYDVELVKVRG